MAGRKPRDLTQGSIYGHIAAMAFPMMIGLTAHMILNLADGMYVTRLGTEEALAVLVDAAKRRGTRWSTYQVR